MWMARCHLLRVLPGTAWSLQMQYPEPQHQAQDPVPLRAENSQHLWPFLLHCPLLSHLFLELGTLGGRRLQGLPSPQS